MAVNLLALAKSLGGSLHSTPRKGRSSGRSSYLNQPGNLQRASHIPGTSIKQGAGLAKKGRRGDTRIRKVKGEPSHVNTIEASAIDRLGPLGEAWVANVGSGTINPRTGLKEYGWLSSAFKGDWGAFGKTKARKARDRTKASASARHATFEAFRRKYEQENIAGIHTESEEDDTNKIVSPYKSGGQSGFEQFVGDLSGLVTSEKAIASSMTNKNTAYGKMASGETHGGLFKGIGEKKFIDTSTTEGADQLAENIANAQAGVRGSNNQDIRDYADNYDTRKQDEALADFNRQGQQLGLQQESAVNADTLNQKNVGSQLSSGLFGMLTQAQENASQQNFAGAGNFAEKFAQKEAIKTAERQVNAGSTDREMTIKEIGIQREQQAADLVTQTKDLQEQYNQEFWDSMISWDSAINA